MIRVLGLSKIYRSSEKDGVDVKALNNVSFTLGNKGLVFIVGKSGSGKSTLLNLLGGLDTIDSGDISVDGVFLSSLKGEKLDLYRNASVGFVFQEYHLFADKSVKDNVALALGLQGKKDDALVASALDEVKIGDLAKRKVSTLSGGQKQRVAIARALVKKPSFILCDEPTGALDFETGAEIMNLLKEISLTKLVVVVSHDLSFASRYGDRVIELKDGCLIGDSKPEGEVAAMPPLSIAKTRIRFKDSLYMALHALKARIPRLALTILLSSMSFAVFGTAIESYFWDPDEAAFSSISTSNNKSVAIARFNEQIPTLIPETKIRELQERFKGKIFIKDVADVDIYGDKIASFSSADDGPKNYGQTIQYPGLSSYYEQDVYGYVHLNGDDLLESGFSLIGRLPEKDDEIAISAYSYNALKKYHHLLTYEGVTVNLDINGLVNRDYKIVGVVDAHFDDSLYEDLAVLDSSERDILISDELRNGFNGCLFLSEEVYAYAKSRDTSRVSISNDEAAIEVEVDQFGNGLESLYADFISSKEEDYYLENPQYYKYNSDLDAFLFTNEWYEANGYTQSYSDGNYRKTINGPDGDYEVVYDASLGRISEEEDPYLIIPERPKIEVSRKEFVDSQLIAASIEEKDSLLNDDDTFIDLGESEAIMAVESEFSPYCVDYLAGNRALSVRANGDELPFNIKAICLKKDSNGKTFTDSALFVDEEGLKTISLLANGSYRLVAQLSDDDFLNREFFDYCLSGSLGMRLEVSNISESAIRYVDDLLSEQVLTFALLASVVVAVLSSLILVSFIAISMSYCRKEVGILRALGASNGDVLSIYALEGILIALINGVLGSIGSLLLGHIINSKISGAFVISIMALRPSFVAPFAIIGLSIFFSLLAVSFPIWKERGKKPIETLTDR